MPLTVLRAFLAAFCPVVTASVSDAFVVTAGIFNTNSLSLLAVKIVLTPGRRLIFDQDFVPA